MVCPHFPPIITGAALHAYNLANGLIKSGITVRVHTIKGSIDRHKENILGLELDDLDVTAFKCFLNLTNRNYKLIGNEEDQPISLSYITSTVRASIDFDIIHVHDGPKVCNDLLILALKKLRRNKPLVFTPHGYLATLPAYERAVTSFAYRWSSKMYWFLGIPHKVIRSPDRVIAVNPFQAQFFTEIIGSRKVPMIPEAVPSYYFVNKPTFGDNEKLRVLFVGRMVEEKGIKDLLFAVYKATKVYNKGNVELVCIGPDCGYLQKAWKIIDDLKLNSIVKILGPLSEHEKIRYLSWCDTLVLPSYHEAFGLTILEAMAQGKPVIATETFGGKSLVKPLKTGFLVRIGDSEGIAHALIKFLQDSELKYQMGRRALKHASKFHMKNMIQNHINLYQNILSN